MQNLLDKAVGTLGNCLPVPALGMVLLVRRSTARNSQTCEYAHSLYAPAGGAPKVDDRVYCAIGPFYGDVPFAIDFCRQLLCDCFRQSEARFASTETESVSALLTTRRLWIARRDPFGDAIMFAAGANTIERVIGIGPNQGWERPVKVFTHT